MMKRFTSSSGTTTARIGPWRRWVDQTRLLWRTLLLLLPLLLLAIYLSIYLRMSLNSSLPRSDGGWWTQADRSLLAVDCMRGIHVNKWIYSSVSPLITSWWPPPPAAAQSTDYSDGPPPRRRRRWRQKLHSFLCPRLDSVSQSDSHVPSDFVAFALFSSFFNPVSFYRH